MVCVCVYVLQCGLNTCVLQSGVRTGSVQGGVVFMAREVTGVLMRWCYRTEEERDKLFECCLTLLHHTLEDSGLGELQ